MSNTNSTPLIVWTGGKRKIVPEIQKFMPQKVSQLVEPFVGGGALSFATKADEYIWNDNNDDLINAYQQLKEHKWELYDLVSELIRQNQDITKEEYYAVRNHFNHLPRNTEERAMYFLLLNRSSFNGLCRYNNKGEFNVPYGKKRALFPEDGFRNFLNIADRITLTCGNFDKIEQYIQPSKNTVVYADQPYSKINDETPTFTKYTKDDFKLEQHEELAQWLLNLDANVIISNHDSDYTRKLYQEFNIHQISVKRLMAADKTKRREVSEIIAYRNKND